MSCKCKISALSPGTIAGMCQTCPHSIRDNLGSAVVCTVSARRVSEIAFDPASPCPVGRFSGTEIVWMGVRWVGVPEPLRWRLTLALGRNPIGLEGCGCIQSVKQSWAGKFIEPWLEGVSLLRGRFGAALHELGAIE